MDGWDGRGRSVDRLDRSDADDDGGAELGDDAMDDADNDDGGMELVDFTGS